MGFSLGRFIGNVGSTIGGVVAFPFKTIFGRSCEEVCVGVWDVVCFIEHFCIPDLVRFFMVCGLSFLCLLFLYLLHKLGICHCVIKVIFKLTWVACETLWVALDYLFCSCWYKIRDTKRVYRGRRSHLEGEESGDVELGDTSDTSTSSDGKIRSALYDNGSSLVRKRKMRRELTRRRSMNHGRSVRFKKGSSSTHFKGRSHRRRRRSRSRSRSRSGSRSRSRSRRRNHLERSGLRRVRRTNTTSFKKQGNR